MKNIKELTVDIDSFATMIVKSKSSLVLNVNHTFDYHIKNKERILETNRYRVDTVAAAEPGYIKSSFLPLNIFIPDQTQGEEKKKQDSTKTQRDPSLYLNSSGNDEVEIKLRLSADETSNLKVANDQNDEGQLMLDTLSWEFLDQKVFDGKDTNKKATIVTAALNQARNIKVSVNSTEQRIYRSRRDKNLYTIEKYKKYSQAVACILMFMIGAPLGAIIKKGGLGMPTIVAILFFIIYYVFTSIGEKSAKEGAMDPYLAVWLSDIVLLPFGLFFLRQARIDARLFDSDFYNIWIEKLRLRFAKNKKEV